MRTRNRRALVGIAALTVASVLLVIDQVNARRASPAKVLDDRRLIRVLPEINFRGQRLNDVVDFIADVSDMPIQVDWQQLAARDVDRDAPVKVRVKEIPVWLAIELIVNSADGGRGVLSWRLDGGSVIISTSVGNTPHVTPWDQVRDDVANKLMMRTVPEVKFSGQGLGDIFDFMNDITDLNVYADWGSMESVGINQDTAAHAMMVNAPTLQVMSAILKSAGGNVGLACWVEDGVLRISTASRVPATATPLGWNTRGHRDVELKVAAAGLAIVGLICLFWRRLWGLGVLAALAMLWLAARSTQVVDDWVWSMGGSRWQLVSDWRQLRVICVGGWEHNGPIVHRATTLQNWQVRASDQGLDPIIVHRLTTPPPISDYFNGRGTHTPAPAAWEKCGVSVGRGPMLGRPGWFIVLPHHWIAALFAVAPMWTGLLHARRMWRAWRWRRRGWCPKCGYDLRATPRQCPECGYEAIP